MVMTQSTPPFGGLMIEALARNWWLFLFRGCCAIVFGILTFAWPGVTLVTLILLYGAYALIDGIFALLSAIMGDNPAPRWWLAAIGVLGIGAGLITWFMPGLTAVLLLYYIAFWAIALGAMQIAGAIWLRKEINNEWVLIASGLISIVFGVILLVQPAAGALGLLLVIGAYAIVHGAALIALALRLKKYSR